MLIAVAGHVVKFIPLRRRRELHAVAIEIERHRREQTPEKLSDARSRAAEEIADGREKVPVVEKAFLASDTRLCA